DLYRVVNHQIDGHKRLDDLRIAIHLRYRRTHSRKIYKQRHSGEILQDNPRHDERNLLLNRIFGIPIRQSLNVDLRNLFPVTVSKHGLEDDSDTDGEPGDCSHTRLLEHWQRVVKAFFTLTCFKGTKRTIGNHIFLPK